jgi:hypothetical protein
MLAVNSTPRTRQCGRVDVPTCSRRFGKVRCCCGCSRSAERRPDGELTRPACRHTNGARMHSNMTKGKLMIPTARHIASAWPYLACESGFPRASHDFMRSQDPGADSEPQNAAWSSPSCARGPWC